MRNKNKKNDFERKVDFEKKVVNTLFDYDPSEFLDQTLDKKTCQIQKEETIEFLQELSNKIEDLLEESKNL